jgi:hypothetical protein
MSYIYDISSLRVKNVISFLDDTEKTLEVKGSYNII